MDLDASVCGEIPSVDAALRDMLGHRRTLGRILSGSGDRYRILLVGPAYDDPGVLWPFQELGQKTHRLFRIRPQDTNVVDVTVEMPPKRGTQRALLFDASPHGPKSGWWDLASFHAAWEDLAPKPRVTTTITQVVARR